MFFHQGSLSLSDMGQQFPKETRPAGYSLRELVTASGMFVDDRGNIFLLKPRLTLRQARDQITQILRNGATKLEEIGPLIPIAERPEGYLQLTKLLIACGFRVD